MADQDKTEKATPRRLSEARNKGQVANSQDLSMALLMLAAAAILTMQGPRVAEALSSNMQEFLSTPPDPNFGLMEAVGIIRRIAYLVAEVVGPMAAIIFVVAFLVGILQSGLKFTPQALEFKPEKFNPITGVKKLVNFRSIVRMAFSLVKFIVLAYILWSILKDRMALLLNLGYMDLPVAAITMLDASMDVLWVISFVLVVMGIGDFIYQKWQHGRDMRMSKQDIKDETKSTEGDPQIKSRIKQAQRRLSRLRMMQEVPGADVVITNPTHAAVALKYDQEVNAAPTVVAKGWNEVALRIKEIAKESGVAVYEEPPLARALCSNVEVGDEIPVRFYQAVAAVLSHVYQLSGRAGEIAGGSES